MEPDEYSAAEPLTTPQGPNERRFLDNSVGDALVDGVRINVIPIVDFSARELLGMVVDATIRASRVVCELDTWIEQLGVPSIVISDNGVEMRSPEIGRWSAESGVSWQSENPANLPETRIE